MGLLTLIPLIPVCAFVVLTLAGFRLPRLLVALIGVGATAASLVLTALLGLEYWAAPASHTVTWYQWLSAGSFAASIGFTLDGLSLVMCAVVTFVGTLILLYSAQFMADDDGYARFFAFMSLFVGSMLVLVLADNLLLLYLGWEGVGLCSYLLIGFWYKERANAAAALKAFLVTRVGDVALALGLFIIFTHLGTLNIAEIIQRAPAQWPVGSAMAVAAAALLLGGAVGKSAQLPLQVWLPDAMAGPSPVSALIHAATMVTAGVYLIARMNAIFVLAPSVQWLVGLVGAATLLVAACSALTQHDLKRVLAYSTMSQVGYMFLALGMGAWTAAIFHLVTHAFFKSLLFLCAGLVIASLHEEHDMFKMGGLRRELPVPFWGTLAGAASLAALPWITAGFYSKEPILESASSGGAVGFWIVALIGAFLTSLYAFRLVFLTFFGARQLAPQPPRGIALGLPLVLLAALALVAGVLRLPVAHVLQASHAAEGAGLSWQQVVAALAPVLGLVAAWALYLNRPQWASALAGQAAVRTIHRFWLSGWGFDWLYARLFVQPFIFLARINRGDFIDVFPAGIAAGAAGLHRLLSRTQNGRVRAYAAAIGLGALILVAVVVLR